MKIYKLLLVFSTLSLFGCSLNEKVTSFSTTDTYYRNAIQIKTGVNGCYNPLRVIMSGSSFFEMTECDSDIMLLNLSTHENSICDISPAHPGVATTVWTYSYSGVMRANEMCEVIENAIKEGYVTKKEGLPLEAEAVIMRAMYYYLLTSTFGDVPFYTCRVVEENRAQIAHLPRMSADSTRNYLIDELMDWFLPTDKGGREVLPLVRSYDNNPENRATAALGLMLAGKFCMWEKRWDDAITVLGTLEKIYGNYRGNPALFGTDYPLTDIPFGKKYTKESILELGNRVDDYGVHLSGYLAAYCTPLRAVNTDSAEEGTDVISDIYNGIAIPELGGDARTYTSIRPTTYFYQQLQGYYSSDLRSGEYSNDSNVARGGSGNLAWRWKGYETTDTVRTSPQTMWFSTVQKNSVNRPWLGNKFWCFGMHNTGDDNNYKIFRYAGALLNLSEAYLEKGDLQTACDYLNVVRVRAGLDKMSPASVSGSKEALMEEIRMECARELFGEYQRKFDLVRWGIWYERTVRYNDGIYIQGFIKPYHRYWPIPDDQVTFSGGALDNDEYKE